MKKKPFVSQHDSMQCGIACLEMICKYYGRLYSHQTLSRHCHATIEGVSLLGISQAAEVLGMETIGVRVTLTDLIELQSPCILHWNQNHFVVYYGRDWRGKYRIADPGKGLLHYKEEDMCRYWLRGDINTRGIALLIKPTQAFYTHQEEQTQESHSFRLFVRYFLQYRKEFGSVLVCAVVGSGLQLLLPLLTQAIVDQGILHQDLDIIYLILLGQLVIILSKSTADFIRSRLLLHIGLRINIALVTDFFFKLLRLPMAFFDVKLLGDLQQRIRDHERVKNFLTTHLLNVAFSFLTFLVFSGVLLKYSKTIFLVFLAGSLFYAVWLFMFLHKRRALDFLNFEQQAENNNKTYQFLSSMQEIKLQGCENRRRMEWIDIQENLYHISMRILGLQQGQEAGSILISEVKNIMITIMAATAVVQGEMTLGMMLAVQYIIGQLNTPVSQMVQFIYSLQDVRISLERINEVHGMEEEDCRVSARKEYHETAHDIIFNGVYFKYDPHSCKETLSGISMTIHQNQVTAIVGASGSGKTTMLKLLLGYYQVLSGNICLAGCNLQEYNLKWWRNRCGVVMQDGVIFSESIARNIAVGDEEIDADRLVKSAQIACVDEFVQALPLKYETKIGKEGIGLSKGQQQRILIARAVYKNPDFIILDEATNSLDANNERAIVKNLAEYYRGKTVIVVAHRLSTVKNADQIVVIQDGKVVETGTHETLIQNQGPYQMLISNQLEIAGI